MFANLRRITESKDELYSKLIMALAVILLLSFLLAFFYVPLIRIFEYSFTSGTEPLGLILKETITNKVNLYAIGFTFLQAFISSILCLLIGLPAGYFLAKYNFKGKEILVNLLTIPFVLPPIVVLAGFLVTYGNSGWVNTIWESITNSTNPVISIFGTVQGIILAHVFYNLSVIIS